jgi:hypothetical protein
MPKMRGFIFGTPGDDAISSEVADAITRGIGAKSLHDLVERTRHRRQRRELFDKAVAAAGGFPALHRLPIAIDGPGTEVTFRIREGFVELDRE